MASDLTIPFFSVRLRFSSGGSMLMPVLDSDHVRINILPEILAGKYADKFQQLVLNKGDFVSLLDEYQGGDFYKDSVSVSFKAAKDKFSFPAFSLDFEYFYKEAPSGYWALVPALGVESYGETAEELETMIEDAIRLEFTRNRRLSEVQRIVSAIWFDSVELQRHDLQFSLPGLKEYEDQKDQKKEEKLLPQVAQKLEVRTVQVYGRQKELQQFERAIQASFHNSVLLVGASGTGKTALVWEMARHLPSLGIEGSIWETTASTLIRELTGETGWEDQLSYLCRELSVQSDILFIRNFLELFEVGQYEGNDNSMAEYLRSFISRGEIRLISECTEEELARIEIRSPNYLSLFQVIRLEEPREQLEEIIIKKVRDLAHGRRIGLDAEAIRETIRLHRRFMPYSGMPGKPIRFLEGMLINQAGRQLQIDRTEIIRNFCEETGMPAFVVDPDIPMDPGEIKNRFNQNIFGQEAAVESIVNLLASVKTALTRTGKPIASLLFVGPTGVGKTEMAKLLAEFMFGSRERMIRFDMSEYSDPYSVLRLAGEHYFSDGLLSGAVRREPFCLLLFDEIEKAHPSFYDLLLQILSEGRLTDSKGRLVNFCSTIIIMTSNIGASNLQTSRISFTGKEDSKDMAGHFLSAVQKHFRPELYNRIDQVIPFKALSRTFVRSVVDREIGLLRRREGIRFRSVDLILQDEVLDYLSQEGYDQKYGARQLQRNIRELLIIPLAKKLNLHDFTDQLVVDVRMEKGELHIHVKANPLGLDLMLETLEKINQADYVSELRRKVVRLTEGHLYIRLISRLHIMERDKKRLKSKFWEKKERSLEYSQLLKVKAEVAALEEKIDLLEEQLALICMEIIPYPAQIAKEIKSREKAFSKLKLELFNYLNPAAGKCRFAIYGTNPREVFAFYKKIFNHKDFEYQLTLVWYREQYYNEEITFVQNEIDIEGREVSIQGKKRREEFIKTEFDPTGDDRFDPPQAGDILQGLELQLSGSCVYPFLEEESGLQHWKYSEKEIFKYQVLVSQTAIKTPGQIIRKDFYKGRPRRVIEPAHVKDNRLNINKAVSKKKQVQPFLEALDNRFENQLDAYLF